MHSSDAWEEVQLAPNEEQPTRRTQVVIVGAGLAGLAAAQRLSESGVQNVLVLEAQDRMGGRVQTVDHSDYILELGAQWLHGAEENPLYQRLNSSDLLEDFEPATLGLQGLFCTEKGEALDGNLVEHVLQILMEIKTNLFNNVHHNSDTSASRVFEQYLLDRLQTDERLKNKAGQVKAILRWFFRFETIENGCNSMEEVSVASYTDYADYGDGKLLNFRYGYRSLLHWFCSQFPADKWIHLNKQVLNIELLTESSSGHSWLDENGNFHSKPVLIKVFNTEHGSSSLTDEIGARENHGPIERIECEQVIVTISLGCLKKNHETLFKPRLPRIKRELIESMGFGTVNKIVLEFERPFWGNQKGIKLVWEEQDKESGRWPEWVFDLLAFDAVRRQENLLIGWIGGEGSKQVEEESEASIAEVCLQLIDAFLPASNGTLARTRLLSCHCSRWKSNPFTCGSYSFRSMKSLNLELDRLWEPVLAPSSAPVSNRLPTSSPKNSRVPRILFAGEATAGRLYSTTHGAVMSGWREADRLAGLLQGKQRLANIQPLVANLQEIDQLTCAAASSTY